MIKKVIDINCDVGEGIGNEPIILPLISSCNIACGGHAGDKETIYKVVKLAKHNGVKVGAHPSFPDRANFGREIMQLPEQVLKASLIEQIERINEACVEQNVTMHHIKPHGALYNLCNSNSDYAHIVISIIESHFPNVKLYAPYKSKIADLAAGKIEVCFEGFADRNYNSDHTLVSRKKDNAVLIQKEAVLQHVLKMILEDEILTQSGVQIATKLDTLCVHGDNPKAVDIVKYLINNLKNYPIKIDKNHA